MATLIAKVPRRSAAARHDRVAAIGDVLLRHRTAISRLQWALVAVYAVLIIVPVLLPLPARADHVWNNMTLFAQFVFWGIWWPFVLISMVMVGRVWCRFLCPVNGVFRVLAKLAPLHFAVDTVQWNAYRLPPGDKFQPVRCAPLMPIRTMASNSNCHMCGNCSGFRGGAVKLALRSPNHGHRQRGGPQAQALGNRVDRLWPARRCHRGLPVECQPVAGEGQDRVSRFPRLAWPQGPAARHTAMVDPHRLSPAQ